MGCGLILLMLLIAQDRRMARPCACMPVSDNEHTRWGNENVVISHVTRIRILRGVVMDSNQGLMANALVEVLTEPDLMLMPSSPAMETRRARQRRVAACLTDDEGNFCLARLPAGRYELRCSAVGFNAVSQTIRVTAKGRISKRVTVHLPFAT
jgi:hypothetical protein